MLLMATARPGAAEAAPSDYVRLHVVANDDTEAAQALKLEVRDACRMAAQALLADCPDADTAWMLLNDNLPLIALAARLRARVCGWEGPVTCEAGVYDFPDRVYDGARVPAGKYRAVRVVIGAGEGRNWWCVLYPSLCLSEDCPPGEPVVFRSAILDWLLGWLGGGT